jgi:hypothetical protein
MSWQPRRVAISITDPHIHPPEQHGDHGEEVHRQHAVTNPRGEFPPPPSRRGEPAGAA